MELVPLNIMYNTFRERHILYNTRNNSSTKTRDSKTVHSGSEIISYLGHKVWHLIRENIKFWKPNEKKIDSCQKIGFIWNVLSLYITFIWMRFCICFCFFLFFSVLLANKLYVSFIYLVPKEKIDNNSSNNSMSYNDISVSWRI